MSNQRIKAIIANLQQISTIEKVEIDKYPWTSDYHQKKILIFFQIPGNPEQNTLSYEDCEEKIDNLRKEKNDSELLALLVTKQLQEERGKNPQDFNTPCPYCQQPTLNVLLWNDEGLPHNIKRPYCRLCRLSMAWVELTQDSIEVQQEMRNYYLTIKKHEISKDADRLFKLLEEKEAIITRIKKAKAIINHYEI